MVWIGLKMWDSEEKLTDLFTAKSETKFMAKGFSFSEAQDSNTDKPTGICLSVTHSDPHPGLCTEEDKEVSKGHSAKTEQTHNLMEPASLTVPSSMIRHQLKGFLHLKSE